MSPADHSLRNTRVIVTRPQHQATNFINLLEDAGAIAIRLPTIEISFHQYDSLKPEATDTAKNSNFWIFTSVNSVIGAIKCKLLPASMNPENTHNTAIAAIGQTTGRCLGEYGIAVDLAPPVNTGTEQFMAFFAKKFNSGDRITIIRGDDGRDRLKKLLESMGCQVNYLSVYRRQLPGITTVYARKTVENAIPCSISVTSDLGLSNLLRLLPDEFHPDLFNCALVVNSERCADLARSYGFLNQIVVANPPGDVGQISALAQLNN